MSIQVILRTVSAVVIAAILTVAAAGTTVSAEDVPAETAEAAVARVIATADMSGTEENAKWYDLSEEGTDRHENVIIQENGDVSYTLYEDGQVQVCYTLREGVETK